jgi:hypothetical protein
MASSDRVASFVTCTTKASGGCDVSKATHGIGALCDPSMIWFPPSIEIRLRPMLDGVANHLTYGPWRRTMPICGDRFWSIANNRNGLPEELFGSIPLSLFAQPPITQIAISINARDTYHHVPWTLMEVSSPCQEIPA